MRQAVLSPLVRLQSKQGSHRARVSLSLLERRRVGGGRRKRERMGKGGRRGGGKMEAKRE